MFFLVMLDVVWFLCQNLVVELFDSMQVLESDME